MKNFCLISFCNIYLLPYAKTYIDAIQRSGAKCTLLFWDRDAVDGKNDNYPGCFKKCYQKRKTTESSKAEMLIGYIEATKFFQRELKHTKYDGLVFLQTHAAVACGSMLKRKYRKKYIVDIRDFTLENYLLYRQFETSCISNSFASVVSSPAYAKFLPKHKYVIAHNYTPFSDDEIQSVRTVDRSSFERAINISFIGTVRFIEMNKRILMLFANDKRFSINFFGNGSEVLQSFCTSKGIKNARFHGAFSPEQTAVFYKDTDLINNLYGNHDNFLDYALSNKLYHSGQFLLPILVCPETYMEEVSQKYHMGYVFDVNDKAAPDKLYEWYLKYDRKELAIGCDRFIDKVILDNRRFYMTIEKFVNL